MSPQPVTDRRPPQVAPVRRPDVIPPHTTVDVSHGDLIGLLSVRLELMHGANHNDPAAWSPMTFVQRKGQR